MSVFRVLSPLVAIASSVCVLLAPAGNPLGAQPLPGYGPSSARYRMTSSMKQSQTQMGQTQEFETASNQLLSLVVSKSGAALAYSMTVDSMTATATAPMPAPDVSAMIGAVVTGAMSVDGQIPTTTVTDKSGKPLTTGADFRPFLPRLKIGATAGATWADTTTETSKQNGADVRTMAIVNYALVGDTTIAGVRGWKVTTARSATIEGAGNQGGADFTIKGTLTGNGSMVIGAGGVFLGGTATNTVSMTIDVPMASMQIPVTQTSSRTITKIP